MDDNIPIWWRYLYVKHFVNLLWLHGVKEADPDVVRRWSQTRVERTPLREAWHDVKCYIGWNKLCGRHRNV